MGGRKIKLGRIRKNEERKRQAKKCKCLGRPSRFKEQTVLQPISENVQLPSLESLRTACVLPPSWSDRLSKSKITLSKVEVTRPEHGAEISCCICIEADLTWKAFVYGVEVPLTPGSVLSNIGDKIISSSSLGNLIAVIDRSNICEGNYEDHFVAIVESRKGTIKSAGSVVSAYLDQSIPAYASDGSVYTKTVRASSCELISDQNKCAKCTAYRKNLRAIHARQQKESTESRSKRVEVSSHTNYRYLSSPEKQARLSNFHTKTRALSRKVDQLKKKLDRLTELNGVKLNHTLDTDIRTIITNNNDAISRSYSQESFEYLFWKQQKDSMLLKDSRQMRWHPMLIKWCIHLHMLSSSCYDSLRSSGVLRLPSERTLRDYTNVIKAKSGFQSEVDEQLYKEAKVEDLAEYQKYIAVIFDEVKIKEDLIYNKHTGELIGFVRLGDINEHLAALEQHCQGEPPSQNLATHMLVFMVRGLFSALKFPYAQFPLVSSTGDVLHSIVWRCIEHLEVIGLKVLAVVCDGASPNRKFFRMHGNKKDLTYKATNLFDKTRSIFFVSDVPHLLKTTRNSWANSHAHTNSRKLWINGQDISWQQLLRVHERHCSLKHSTPGLSILTKLKYEHLHLTSYSKMRVDLAAQVLSTTVANAFAMEEDEALRETERFIRAFDKFFDLMNVRNATECIYNRKPNLRPYRKSTNPRLLWLEGEFLSYLDEWEKSVGERELEDDDRDEDMVEKTKEEIEKAKEKMMIAQETRTGLRITVKSVVELVRYCLDNITGVKYVLTEHLCQDPLEAFFGRQRMSCGRNDNPNVQTFLQNTSSLRVQGSAAMNPFRGNCRRGKRKREIVVDDTPLPKCKQHRK